MLYCIFDTETTGNDPNGCGLVQLAAIIGRECDEGCPVPADQSGCESLSMLVKPHLPVTPASLAVHGITNEKAAQEGCGYREARSAMKNAVAKALEAHGLLDNDLVFIAHNAPFDTQVMQKTVGYDFSSGLVIDTLRWAKKIVPKKEIGGHSMDALHCWAFPDAASVKWLHAVRANHDALADCRVLQRVFNALYWRTVEKEFPEGVGLERLAGWIDEKQMITVWPFGKHKGEKIDPHSQYATWAIKNVGDSFPDVVWSIKQMRKGADKHKRS